MQVASAPLVTGLTDFPHEGSEAQALTKIGSLPVWSAVLERDRFLSRRGQSGVMHGLLVDTPWGLCLVDETEGQGSLWSQVLVPTHIETPKRVLLWGSWHRQHETGSWVWQATRAQGLESNKQDPLELVPRVAQDLERPAGAVLASSVPRRGGVISFVVVERGSRIGDGWLIADEVDGPAVARLLLPGERHPYGGQSVIAEAERWNLRPAESYWITIKRFRPGSSASLPVYRAKGLPGHDSSGPIREEQSRKESTQ